MHEILQVYFRALTIIIRVIWSIPYTVFEKFGSFLLSGQNKTILEDPTPFVDIHIYFHASAALLKEHQD